MIPLENTVHLLLYDEKRKTFICLNDENFFSKSQKYNIDVNFYITVTNVLFLICRVKEKKRGKKRKEA